MEKVDLHTHTYLSDGIYSPTEVVKLASDRGISILSITDHDNTSGITEAITAAKDYGIEIISGVEISTDIEDREVHILGYFMDINNEELNKYLSFFRDERFHRAKRIILKLNKLGIRISMDDVLVHANNSAIGRPHIAYALLDLGYIENYYHAFDKYIGDNGPAYERKIHVSPQSALKIISDSGGLSFIAHPANMKESVILALINAGIDGIEVIHPSHSDSQEKFYKGIVAQYCLLATGGSDFHGGKKNDDAYLGKYFITPSYINTMKKMLQR